MFFAGRGKKETFVVQGALASLFHDQSHYNLFYYDLVPFISDAHQSPVWNLLEPCEMECYMYSKNDDGEGKKMLEVILQKIKITQEPVGFLSTPPFMIWRDDCFPVFGRERKISRSVSSGGGGGVRIFKGV